MKLIIDIPEDDYELVQKYIYPQRVFYELVHGTPIPDNATVCDIDAIRAEPKTGHWVEENINEWSRKVFCSECGCPPPFEHISNGDIYSVGGYGVNNKTNFCPNCGAKMVEQETKINEDISKGFEEFTRMMFKQGPGESEDKE